MPICLLEDFSPGAPPPALHSYIRTKKIRLCLFGHRVVSGVDRPGNVAPCLSSHDTGWEYAIEVTNDGKVVPLRRRDGGGGAA